MEKILSTFNTFMYFNMRFITHAGDFQEVIERIKHDTTVSSNLLINSYHLDEDYHEKKVFTLSRIARIYIIALKHRLKDVYKIYVCSTKDDITNINDFPVSYITSSQYRKLCEIEDMIEIFHCINDNTFDVAYKYFCFQIGCIVYSMFFPPTLSISNRREIKVNIKYASSYSITGLYYKDQKFYSKTRILQKNESESDAVKRMKIYQNKSKEFSFQFNVSGSISLCLFLGLEKSYIFNKVETYSVPKEVVYVFVNNYMRIDRFIVDPIIRGYYLYAIILRRASESYYFHYNGR